MRRYLYDALRIDPVGPRPGDAALQHERLPRAPSRWYLTGFLAPGDAPKSNRRRTARRRSMSGPSRCMAATMRARRIGAATANFRMIPELAAAFASEAHVRTQAVDALGVRGIHDRA